MCEGHHGVPVHAEFYNSLNVWISQNVCQQQPFCALHYHQEHGRGNIFFCSRHRVHNELKESMTVIHLSAFYLLGHTDPMHKSVINKQL